jgi:hypothetical protein
MSGQTNRDAFRFKMSRLPASLPLKAGERERLMQIELVNKTDVVRWKVKGIAKPKREPPQTSDGSDIANESQKSSGVSFFSGFLTL